VIEEGTAENWIVKSLAILRVVFIGMSDGEVEEKTESPIYTQPKDAISKVFRILTSYQVSYEVL
jgi:hypothetical protein